MLRILLVDDEAPLRRLLRNQLRASLPGVEIVEASSVGEACDVFAAAPFDLVMTDVVMEQSDAGWQLAHFARLHGTPVILMSGYAESATLGDLEPLPLVSKAELLRLDLAELVHCAITTQSLPEPPGPVP